MKDINYDLIKLLLTKMDTVWRLKKFYCDDAKKEHCKSADVLQNILADEQRHLDQLRSIIKERCTKNIFD